MTRILVNLPPPPGGITSRSFPADIAIDLVEDHEPKAGRVFPEDRLSDIEVLLCDFPPANFEEMISLRWIQLASVGFNQLAGPPIVERGIRVTNARGVFDVPIAEWNVAMMINLARHAREMFANQAEGIWDRSPRFQNELRGATVGLWGYGGIARETARLAKAMGLRIHVMTRRGIASRDDTYRVEGTGDPDGVLPDRVFRGEEKIEFLSGLDFLILALPLSPSTEGLIGKEELAALPESAFVLNPSRGPIIEEAALLDALADRSIAGAALDTHYHYPMPPDHPLWRMPNVLMTPHISGSNGSPHYRERVWDIFGQNLGRFIEGAPLLNEVASADLVGN